MSGADTAPGAARSGRSATPDVVPSGTNAAAGTAGFDTAGLVLGTATVAMGLMAGLFYAFDGAIMLALSEVDDRTFVDVMQRIDDRIQNPLFFLIFMGALLLPAIAAWQHWRRGPHPATRWIVAGFAFYLAVVVITSAINIPLNEDLVNAGDPDAIPNLAAVRDDFEDPWVAWNIVRTVASTAALACLGRALVLHGRGGR